MKLLDRFLYPRTCAVMDRCEVVIAEASDLLDRIESLEIATDIDAGDAWLDPRYPAAAERLPVPCWVKVGGEYERFEGIDGWGRMVIFRDGCAAPCFYEPSEGEKFAWQDLI